MKKTGIKNFIKGIIVIIVFAVSMLAANRILMLKSEDGYDQMRSYYKQKDNTVDVLFLGSSRVYCNIDTGVLWDDFGIAAFDLGGAEATTWNSYYFLKEALKTQKPKVIFYDASMIGFKHDVIYQPDVWSQVNDYGMKWNENRIGLLRENCETDETFKKLLIPFATMHSRYNELTENDFKDNNDSINYKGFDYRASIDPYDKPTSPLITEESPVNEKHIRFLKMMFELARSYNIPFITIVAPADIPDDEAMHLNTIRRICGEEGITYIEFNDVFDDIGLDFSVDTADGSHLNFSGTKKYCDYLGKYIKDNFDVPDRRGDSNYSSWEADALINRQNRFADALGKADEDEFEELVKNEAYITFRQIDGPVYVYNGENLLLDRAFTGELKADDTRLKFDNNSGFGSLFIDDSEYGFEPGKVIVYDTVLKKVVYNKVR